MTLDGHGPIGADSGQQRIAGQVQAAHQGAGAAVDEPLHQPLVQGVGQSVLQRAGLALPVRRVAHPVAAIGHIGQGPHPGQARRQGVDIAVQPVQALELALDPVVGQAPVALRQMLEDGPNEARMILPRGLAEIGGLAHLPQLDQVGPVAAAADDDLVARQVAQRALVQALFRQFEASKGRRRREVAQQALQGLEFQPGVAPLRRRNRIKGVVFDRGDQVWVHLRAIAGDAKGPVLAIAPGAPADLTDLLGVEPAGAAAVIFAQAGKGHMTHIHVQAHADGVGGHQEIDLARLKQFDLGVAGAGAQRAHHHRRAAALAADQFGDGVDRVGREGDHGAAPGQAGQFLGAVIGQAREALPRLDFSVRAQAANQGAHGRRAQQHGLRAAARMQQPMGEDVAALGIGAQLDLVDRQEFHLAVQRHGLHRADEILRPGRDDLFLARDQGHAARATRLDHPIIDLAGQEAQRQADHARGVTQHPLHGQVGLAGIGRAKHGHETRGRSARRAITHAAKVGRRGESGKRRRKR